MALPSPDSQSASTSRQQTQQSAQRSVAWLRARLQYMETAERYYQQLYVRGYLNDDATRSLGK